MDDPRVAGSGVDKSVGNRFSPPLGPGESRAEAGKNAHQATGRSAEAVFGGLLSHSRRWVRRGRGGRDYSPVLLINVEIILLIEVL
jgi:hypothetical protein